MAREGKQRAVEPTTLKNKLDMGTAKILDIYYWEYEHPKYGFSRTRDPMFRQALAKVELARRRTLWYDHNKGSRTRFVTEFTEELDEFQKSWDDLYRLGYPVRGIDRLIVTWWSKPGQGRPKPERTTIEFYFTELLLRHWNFLVDLEDNESPQHTGLSSAQAKIITGVKPKQYIETLHKRLKDLDIAIQEEVGSKPVPSVYASISKSDKLPTISEVLEPSLIDLTGELEQLLDQKGHTLQEELRQHQRARKQKMNREHEDARQKQIKNLCELATEVTNAFTEMTASKQLFDKLWVKAKGTEARADGVPACTKDRIDYKAKCATVTYSLKRKLGLGKQRAREPFGPATGRVSPAEDYKSALEKYCDDLQKSDAKFRDFEIALSRADKDSVDISDDVKQCAMFRTTLVEYGKTYLHLVLLPRHKKRVKSLPFRFGSSRKSEADTPSSTFDKAKSDLARSYFNFEPIASQSSLGLLRYGSRANVDYSQKTIMALVAALRTFQSHVKYPEDPDPNSGPTCDNVSSNSHRVVINACRRCLEEIVLCVPWLEGPDLKELKAFLGPTFNQTISPTKGPALPRASKA